MITEVNNEHNLVCLTWLHNISLTNLTFLGTHIMYISTVARIIWISELLRNRYWQVENDDSTPQRDIHKMYILCYYINGSFQIEIKAQIIFPLIIFPMNILRFF